MTVPVIVPRDPNEKHTSLGVGEQHYVARGDELSYEILFENKATATAPAQEVFIDDQLDDDLDWSTFRIGEVTFGDQVVSTLAGKERGNTRVQAGDMFVDIGISFVPVTGRARWVLRTIDPATGDLPEDAYAGFLPPEDGNGRGQGHVSFTIRTRSDRAAGTQITNTASIVFDTEAPLVTNEVLNTITDDPPSVPAGPNIADGATDVAATTVFAWEATQYAGSYDIYLWPAGQEKPTEPTGANLTAPMFDPPGELADATAYSWQVVAKNVLGSTPSPVWGFTTGEAYTPPVAVDDSGTTDEDTPVTLAVLGNDTVQAGLTLTIEFVSPPEHGTTEIVENAVRYVPEENFNGADQFTYGVTDGIRTVIATATVTVNPVNDQPTDIVLSNGTVQEAQSLNTTVGTLSTADVDGGSFTYTLPVGIGDNASFNISGSTLRTSAIFDYETKNSYAVRVRSTDNGGLSTEKDYTITVIEKLDVVEPTSSILVPADGASLMATTYRIAGSAADNGSGVDKVEIAVNGGGWVAATGTTSWHLDWTVPADGAYTIRSRATDKTGNVETPGAGVTVTAYKRTPSTITVSGRQLLLAGNPFAIKGVVYAPVPVGVDPETTAPYGDYFKAAYADIQDRDLSLLRQMGANAVLIPSWGNTVDHHAFLDKAYNSGLNPVYVIAGFRVEPGLDIDPDSPSNVREQIKEDFLEMVETHRSHPAILFWSIGSELNAPGMYGGDLENLFSLVDELAVAAHEAEGGAAHPVAAALSDNDLIATIVTYDGAVPNLDLWGPAVYRGGTFGTLFTDYETASGKPLAILGYGIDAYDSAQGDEYEKLGAPLQGDYAVGLWGEIEAHAAPSGICVGGTIAEYSDQWWRGKNGSGAGCPDADPDAQSACGQTDPTEPDGFLNEEWGGLVRIAGNGSAPDLVQPREAYYALQYLWEPDGLNAVITESPQSLAHFGSVNIGLISTEQVVTFTNSGTTNLAIGAMFFTGANPADFGTRHDGCSGRTLVPADSCTVGVVFTPTALSARSAIFSVPCSDPVRGTVTMALQGTGIDTLPPTGSVTINGGAAAIRSTSVTLTLSAVDFGGGAIQMCVSNSAKCTAWETFAQTKSWKLTKGKGTKTVYARFRDALGNVTPATTPYTDTVVVDKTAPVNGRLRATPGVGQIALSWDKFSDALSGIDRYKLVFAIGAAPASCAKGKVIHEGASTIRSFTHTGLINKTYGYRVCAIDKVGNVSTGATWSGKPRP